MMSVWGALAAVVPILGSLWAGASFIGEQLELRREKRVRHHVQALVEDYRNRRHAEGMKRGLDAGASYQRAIELATGFEDRMLGYHGVRAGGITSGEFDVQIRMSAPVVPRSELLRQSVVVFTAAAGVAFLAIAGGSQ